MTLWKAMVRPILEYAAELWAGEIPLEMVRKAEQVQTDFAKGLLGLRGKRAIASDVVRAEMGLEKIESRCQKLRLGYWRRVQVAGRERTLRLVASMRRAHVLRGGKLGRGSWMQGTRALLQEMDLAGHWFSPSTTRVLSKDEWKKAVYRQVEEWQEVARRARMRGLQSMERYFPLKCWAEVRVERAQYKGEIGRKGALVMERYLDDTAETAGTKLKLLCRMGCLPVMQYIAQERGWHSSWARCLMCESGKAESISHVLLECRAYEKHRDRMLRIARAGGVSPEWKGVSALLGGQLSRVGAENNIDHAVKRFLKKAWRVRKGLTKRLNTVLGRKDEAF